MHDGPHLVTALSDCLGELGERHLELLGSVRRLLDEAPPARPRRRRPELVLSECVSELGERHLELLADVRFLLAEVTPLARSGHPVEPTDGGMPAVAGAACPLRRDYDYFAALDADLERVRRATGAAPAGDRVAG